MAEVLEYRIELEACCKYVLSDSYEHSARACRLLLLSAFLRGQRGALSCKQLLGTQRLEGVTALSGRPIRGTCVASSLCTGWT